MGRKKLQKTLPRIVSLALIAALCVGGSGATGALASELETESVDDAAVVYETTEVTTDDADEAEAVTDAEDTEVADDTTSTVSDSSSDENVDEYVSERISHNYTVVSADYTLSDYTGSDVVYEMSDIVTDVGTAELTTDTKDFTGSSTVLALEYEDEVTLQIDVPQSGLYFIAFDYISYDESIMPLEIKMQVDGDYPFYEMRNIELKTTFAPQEEKSYDRYDNELVTIPEKVIQWEHDYLYDSAYRHSGPLKVELTAGTHEITIDVDEGTFLLGAIYLVAPFETEAYSGTNEVAEGDALIEVQGEDYAYTNDSSIHATVEYDTSLDPYEVVDTVLNTIDSDSFDTAGQSITYEFEVEEAGYYYIALNYRQSDKTNFPVFMDIRVDGEIPNTAFEAYGLAYSTKYKTSTLADDDGNYLSVYLDKGTHTLSFTISMDPICFVMEALDSIMTDINDLALEITKVAGTNTDKYRDLQLSRYISGIDVQLNGYADELYDLIEQCRVAYTPNKKNVAVMSSMSIAAEQLYSLAENVDDIPYRVDELASSSNSANQYLANTIDNLIANNVAIDRIYIYQQDAKLPGKTGFIKSMGMNIMRFAASFTNQAYSASNVNKDHLQVWVNRSSQYVQTMQKMIDETFTPETGIEVDISIMPDQYKLVLANSTGNAPDVATGINYTIPYELAIRGALVDMTQFDDFKEVAEPYEPGFFITGTIQNGIYSMPETMNIWVLFYRTDVLEKLGLEVPDTMDDVIAMLPELQMRGLNFYYPTAGMTAMRNFHGTTPLIMQNGGALYYDDASEGTALGEETSVTGFTALTDLFTIYNLDVNVDNFYQHFRNGDLPIGIADIAAYNLLKNAAPELSSSWDISVIPGTVQEDGTVDRTTCGCAESTVMFDSGDETRIEQAWEFVKWWSSSSVQAEFGQTIQITYGDEYMWPTANMEAFDLLPWDSSDKAVIKEFAKNVVDVARVPGTYMLEREMSNAFNDITVNGKDEQTRIDKAVKTINRELSRKMEEFGFTDSDGNSIESYPIPTIESVKRILGRE